MSQQFFPWVFSGKNGGELQAPGCGRCFVGKDLAINATDVQGRLFFKGGGLNWWDIVF